MSFHLMKALGVPVEARKCEALAAVADWKTRHKTCMITESQDVVSWSRACSSSAFANLETSWQVTQGRSITFFDTIPSFNRFSAVAPAGTEELFDILVGRCPGVRGPGKRGVSQD